MSRTETRYSRRAMISLALAGALAAATAMPAAANVGTTATADKKSIQRILVEEALRNGVVPPALALAVARVESNFQAGVTSHAGARGVMQIMPATAKGEFGVDAGRLYDARLNVQLGVTFLNRLYDMYGQRWDLALSHYNGGSLKKSGGQWQPHSYTRKYVADVMRFWNEFQRDRWVAALISESQGNNRFAGAAQPAGTDADRQARMAADYAYLETPDTDRNWRDYLQVADRWLTSGAGEGAGSVTAAQIQAPVDFSTSAAADPSWHYPLEAPAAAGGAERLTGPARFLNSGQFWRMIAGGGRFN